MIYPLYLNFYILNYNDGRIADASADAIQGSMLNRRTAYE